ncbi:mucin-5AC%2C partial [Xyrichtys novacula]|uniref:Mucin-5AC, partial n=1 Tax=Xyrichtys novacula TaxID=13765 RepID=A0AAV1FWG2_XYRNO|nr:mucin-5AC%2C partial [Xyrichtys novacula]
MKCKPTQKISRNITTLTSTNRPPLGFTITQVYEETTKNKHSSQTALQTSKCTTLLETHRNLPPNRPTLRNTRCPSFPESTSMSEKAILKTQKLFDHVTSQPQTYKTSHITTKCPSFNRKSERPQTSNTSLRTSRCPLAKGTTTHKPMGTILTKTTSIPAMHKDILRTTRCPYSRETTNILLTNEATLTTTSILPSSKQESVLQKNSVNLRLRPQKTTSRPPRNSSTIHSQTTNCWTEWFDRDNPSGTGDWETLGDLWRENPGKICNMPLQIEVQTVTGLSVTLTGNVITVADTTTGFICKNSDQTNGTCHDYRVRFMCPTDFCIKNDNLTTHITTTNLPTKAPENCWTDWFDRDDPCGTGDFESLSVLQYENPGKICNKPLQIEVQTTAGLSVAATGDVIDVADVTTGFICKNSDQTNGTCHDYRVRFMCSPNFCSQEVCWTKWFDRDNPSGIGDLELLRNLKKENPGEICESPLYIDVSTTDTNTTAISTGQSFHIYSPTEGFVCRNRDQSRGRCQDYQVRFGCPCPCKDK